MDKTSELKRRLLRVAWEQAPRVLEAAGILKDHKYYSLRLYEMQFAIYHQLKLSHDIE